MIYNHKLKEHLAYISKEEFYARINARGNVMVSQFEIGDKYACPDCLSTGVSTTDRKKRCALCSGKGVVFV